MPNQPMGKHPILEVFRILYFAQNIDVAVACRFSCFKDPYLICLYLVKQASCFSVATKWLSKGTIISDSFILVDIREFSQLGNGQSRLYLRFQLKWACLLLTVQEGMDDAASHWHDSFPLTCFSSCSWRTGQSFHSQLRWPRGRLPNTSLQEERETLHHR